MATKKKKSPAKKDFCVYATESLYQHVEATSAEEAYRIAEKDWFEPCGDLEFEPDVQDLETHEFIRVGEAAPETESQDGIKTTGNFMVHGKNGERIAAFACESDRRIFDAALPVREASQKLYDAINRYLMGTPASEEQDEMVDAMNELEAAWHRADGTVPEKN